jgi:hypothetical protein
LPGGGVLFNVTGMSQGNDPLPVMPLNYQKPAGMPWRPVRVAFGIYFLASGVAMMTSYAFSIFAMLSQGRGFTSLTMIANVYILSGLCSLVAGVAYVLDLKWARTMGLVAATAALGRSILQLYSVYANSLSRVSSSARWQMLVSFSGSFLIPLALIYFTLVFNRYDKSQDNREQWT